MQTGKAAPRLLLRHARHNLSARKLESAFHGCSSVPRGKYQLPSMGDQDFTLEQPLTWDEGSRISYELGLVGQCSLVVSGCTHLIYDGDNHVRNLRGARAAASDVVKHRLRLLGEVHTVRLRYASVVGLAEIPTWRHCYHIFHIDLRTSKRCSISFERRND